jgi:hypothetical protein
MVQRAESFSLSALLHAVAKLVADSVFSLEAEEATDCDEGENEDEWSDSERSECFEWCCGAPVFVVAVAGPRPLSLLAAVVLFSAAGSFKLAANIGLFMSE